jgi:hypothetical protein
MVVYGKRNTALIVEEPGADVLSIRGDKIAAPLCLPLEVPVDLLCGKREVSLKV